MKADKAGIGMLITLAGEKQKKVLNRFIKESGFNFEMAHFRILMASVHYPGTLYAKNLVISENKTKSTINVLLSKLEHENLITIDTDPKDKRAKRVKPTELGIKITEQLTQYLDSVIDPILSNGIVDEERKIFIKVITQHIQNLDQINNEDSTPFIEFFKNLDKS